MIRTFYYLFVVAVAAACFHTAPGIAQTSEESEVEVESLEKKYFQALESQDRELMDSLLLDSFVISSMSSGRSMDREAFLDTLPEQVITSQEITATKVEIKGDKAYSQVDISMTKTFKGKDHSGSYEVYSVWVKMEGGWKLLERKIKFLEQS